MPISLPAFMRAPLAPTAFDRRSLLVRAGAGLAAGLGLAQTAHAASQASGKPAKTPFATLADLGFSAEPGRDQGQALQAAIDQAAERGVGLRLSPGTLTIGRRILLRPGTSIAGGLGATRLVFASGAGLIAQNAADLRIDDLILDGGHLPLVSGIPLVGGIEALLTLEGCVNARLSRIEARDGTGNGIVLKTSSGSISACHVHGLRKAGLLVLDGAPGSVAAIEIAHNHVHDCGDNGILVWASQASELGAIVTANRIERIAARSGGTGQNGNGINVFRAAGVIVSNNRIADCAYSAIRGNAASNIQMIGNNCMRSGEVALYAEFGFEGALIANNIVDTAAAGISVTNFNEGGRLAVVQGNLIRNLARREHEPDDKRGEGISVEADSVVTGNVVEGAPTAGIFIGWGRHMREVAATGNLIRRSKIGIAVQAEAPGSRLAGLVGAVAGRPAKADASAQGSVLIAGNRISGATDGAIRTLHLHVPFGPDLANAAASPFTHIVTSGNVAS